MDPSLRAECTAPALPADPVTASSVMQFSLEQERYGACQQNRAGKLLEVIDAHNDAAQEQ